MELYEDSMVNNWQEILKKKKINGFSIFHDRDIKKETGELKKPHYHVLIRYKYQTALSTAKILAKQLAIEIGAANNQVIEIRDYKKHARYLIHKDNPEKAQYDIDDVESYGGEDYKKLIEDSEKERMPKVLSEIIEFCNDNNLYSYSDLVEYCRTDNKEWFQLITGRYLRCIITYLKSKHWTDCHLNGRNIR